MQKLSFRTMALCALLIMSAAIPPKNSYTISKGFTVTINGTSNLHAWTERVETVNGAATVDWNVDGSFDINAANIRMAVRSIKSTEGSIMNNNTYKALKADEHPEIIFALTTPIKAIPGGTHVVTTKVNLTIAGVTRVTDIEIKSTSAGAGKMQFEGTKSIKMTDYGIKPPVALFGTLKTGDEITIHFNTVFTIAE